MQYEAAVDGMTCPNCAAKLERAVTALGEVRSVDVDLMGATLSAEISQAAVGRQIDRTVERLGFEVVGDQPEPADGFGVDRRLGSVITAAVLIGVALVLELGLGQPDAAIWLYAAATAVGAATIIGEAAGSIRQMDLDINILMLIAAVGALVLGQWLEAAMVTTLFAFAQWLEAASMQRARHAIGKLGDLAPAEARIRGEDGEKTVDIDQVVAGQIAVVRPGETIPVDGVVARGTGEVDQSSMTGEAKPVAKGPGDEVFAGSLNQRGSLDIRVDRASDERTISKIIETVKTAQADRSRTERLVDRFARWYTPVVVAVAVALAVGPPLIVGASFAVWGYRALVVLVTACPCALVLATPLTTASGLARAARDGILIKGGRHLEALGQTTAVAFDKTGTLTRATPAVAAVEPAPTTNPHDVLAAAALAESRSEHAIGAAICAAAAHQGIEVDSCHIETFEAQIGRGIRAETADARLLVGRPQLLDAHGIDHAGLDRTWRDHQSRGQTVVGVARDDELLGLIALRDRPRQNAKSAIDALTALPCDAIYLLTGDNPDSAQTLAADVGLAPENVRAGLMPDDKLAAIDTLGQRHEHVAMVGDGINDAPALAAASTGIAMGAAGTDIALDTADITLMADDPAGVAAAISLGRKSRRIIAQNIAITLVIKAAVFGLAAAGMATLWMAVVADMGTSLVVIANGLRMLRAADERHRGNQQATTCSP